MEGERERIKVNYWSLLRLPYLTRWGNFFSLGGREGGGGGGHEFGNFLEVKIHIVQFISAEGDILSSKGLQLMMLPWMRIFFQVLPAYKQPAVHLHEQSHCASNNVEVMRLKVEVTRKAWATARPFLLWNPMFEPQPHHYFHFSVHPVRTAEHKS